MRETWWFVLLVAARAMKYEIAWNWALAINATKDIPARTVQKGGIDTVLDPPEMQL